MLHNSNINILKLYEESFPGVAGMSFLVKLCLLGKCKKVAHFWVTCFSKMVIVASCVTFV
jgi:hypothetical protein